MSEESVLACVTEVTGMMWRKMASYFQDFAPVFKFLYNKKDMSGARSSTNNIVFPRARRL